LESFQVQSNLPFNPGPNSRNLPAFSTHNAFSSPSLGSSTVAPFNFFRQAVNHRRTQMSKSHPIINKLLVAFGIIGLVSLAWLTRNVALMKNDFVSHAWIGICLCLAVGGLIHLKKERSRPA